MEKEKIIINLIDIIKNTFGEIRSDWNDPRGFCYFGNKACDILSSVITNKENSLEKADKFIKDYINDIN